MASTNSYPCLTQRAVAPILNILSEKASVIVSAATIWRVRQDRLPYWLSRARLTQYRRVAVETHPISSRRRISSVPSRDFALNRVDRCNARNRVRR